MSARFLATQALFPNSRKLLAYALLGYLNRLLVHGTFDFRPCLTPSVCQFTVCGKCKPLYIDAFDIFGVPTIFDAADHPDMPAALREVLLSLDEYEGLPKSIMKPKIEGDIDAILKYLTSQPENDQDSVRPIFKLFMPDMPR